MQKKLVSLFTLWDPPKSVPLPLLPCGIIGPKNKDPPVFVLELLALRLLDVVPGDTPAATINS